MGGGISSVSNEIHALQCREHDSDSEHVEQNLRSSIFAKSGVTHISHHEENEDMLESTKSILEDALSTIFFLQSDAKNISKLVHGMQKQTYPPGDIIMKEGDMGSSLFVCEHGELDVLINNEIVRTVETGAMIGELALLYDSPRSATVICKTTCVLWCLQREIFKSIRATASAYSQIATARLLSISPELSILQGIDVSRLICALQIHSVKCDQFIYRQDVTTNTITLIEEGSASIFTTHPIDPKWTLDEVDKFLGIIRPKPANGGSPLNSSRASPENKFTHQFMVPKSLGAFACEVSEGCLIGVNILLGKAGLPDGWEWIAKAPDTALSSKHTVLKQMMVMDDGGAVCPFTAVSMDNLTCQEFNVETFESLFGPCEMVLNPEYDEHQAAIRAESSKLSSFVPKGSHGSPKRRENEMLHDDDILELSCVNFKWTHVLGRGKFGTICAAEYGRGISSHSHGISMVGPGHHHHADNVGIIPTNNHHLTIPHTITPPIATILSPRSSKSTKSGKSLPWYHNMIFAVKVFGKDTVVSKEQSRHVQDERTNLLLLDSPFIEHYYGSYQTPHQVMLVLEALEFGDLWSVLFGKSPYRNNRGLPPGLVIFYAASIVLALSHMHSHGIIYRNIKPENLMFDSKGYIKLVDLGFSKRVPYTVKVAAGGELVHTKSFTTCGAAEYLAPEMIFNLGHNHSADIWALGILIYEMTMGITPFASKNPDNMTELFTNIAMIKTKPIHISHKFDKRACCADARPLLLALLKYDPTERLGVRAGSTGAILRHPYFSEFHLDALMEQSLRPEYIPRKPTDFEPASALVPVKHFQGDQDIFAGF